MAIGALLNIPPLYAGLAIIFGLLSYIIFQSRTARLEGLPGPFLAKYTDAWRAFQAWKLHDTGVNFQTTLFQKYGDVIRIGPRSVLVNDPEAITTVLGIKARLNKGPGYIAFQQPGAPPSLVSTFDEHAHGVLRRPINHAYTLSALKGYEPYIDDTINELVSVLDGHASREQSIDIAAWLHYWSYDVIGKLSFGEPIGFMEHGSDFTGMIQAQRDFSKYVDIIFNWPWLHFFFHGRRNFSMFRNKPSVFTQFARRTVRERLAQADADADADLEKKQFPDFLSKFIEAKQKYPQVVTDGQIATYSQSNVIAGSLTTSQTLSSAMDFLSKNLPAQERLFHEIVQVENEEKHENEDEEESPVALNLAQKIPYLEAVILESYRKHKSSSVGLERVVGSEGLQLPSGERLIPGTLVSMSPATLSRRPDVYGPDVDVFNPLRWMRKKGEPEDDFAQRKNWMNQSMVQFGHGSRICMGKNLVQLEMFKVLATLLGRYQFEAVGDPNPQGLWVKVSRREKT